VVRITHEQNIICSETHLDSITHELTIICRQLFAGHVLGSRPMKRKKKCIEPYLSNTWLTLFTSLTSSHLIPSPMYPGGHSPHLNPSRSPGVFVHSTNGKQGFSEHLSAEAKQDKDKIHSTIARLFSQSIWLYQLS